jgi:hypothetical protein
VTGVQKQQQPPLHLWLQSIRFTAREEQALEEGVTAHGDNFYTILANDPHNFQPCRNGNALRVKWKRMLKKRAAQAPAPPEHPVMKKGKHTQGLLQVYFTNGGYDIFYVKYSLYMNASSVHTPISRCACIASFIASALHASSISCDNNRQTQT